MNSFVCSVATYLVNATWEIPLVAIAALAVTRLQKRLGPQAQHRTWVGALALAVLTPSISFWSGIASLFPSLDSLSGISMIAVTGMQTVSSGKNAATLPAFIILALFCGYICVLLYFAARFLWSLWWTTQFIRNASPVSLNTNGEAMWSRCKQAFSLEKATILSSQQISGPVAAGFGAPVLILPPTLLQQCTSHDFLTALGHECAHMKRHDFQKNLFYEAISLLVAFHPVTWILKSQIAQTREMICDAMAVEKLIDSHSYTQSLLRLAAMALHASRASTSHAIGIFDANILEKRIMQMKMKKHNLSVAAKCALIVPGALLLCSIAAGAARIAVSIQPAQSLDNAYSGQIYHVGGDVSAPKVISYVDPDFPKSGRRGKGQLQGVCVLKTVIDTSGRPIDVQIVRSLRHDFDVNAIDAVRQYRFTPAMKAGVAVPVAVNIEVNFKIY